MHIRSAMSWEHVCNQEVAHQCIFVFSSLLELKLFALTQLLPGGEMLLAAVWETGV